RINQYNIKYIFMFAKSFYSYQTKNQEMDLNVIKHMIQKIDIQILPYKNGLFDINEGTFDKGNLSDSLVKFILEFSNKNYSLAQFLVTHIEEPHRIFLRLLKKNIPKIDKITKFLKDNDITKTPPNWLPDTTYIRNIIDRFIDVLGQKMANIYTEKMDELRD